VYKLAHEDAFQKFLASHCFRHEIKNQYLLRRNKGS
jgi:hypothetical protein